MKSGIPAPTYYTEQLYKSDNLAELFEVIAKRIDERFNSSISDAYGHKTSNLDSLKLYKTTTDLLINCTTKNLNLGCPEPMFIAEDQILMEENQKIEQLFEQLKGRPHHIDYDIVTLAGYTDSVEHCDIEVTLFQRILENEEKMRYEVESDYIEETKVPNEIVQNENRPLTTPSTNRPKIRIKHNEQDTISLSLDDLLKYNNCHHFN